MMGVHSGIGYGFEEVVYQRALAYELGREGLSFDRECEMPVFYEGCGWGRGGLTFLWRG